MRLTVIGCSGSFAGPDSPASCYLLQAEDPDGRTWNLVMELGSGAFGPLQRHVQPEEIDAVLISHLHADHCADLAGLNVYAKHRPQGPITGITVCGPTHTARWIAESGDPAAPPTRLAFEMRTWQDKASDAIGPFMVTPRRVSHVVETYGLRITGPGEAGGEAVIAFTGDTDLCPAVAELGKGAHLLLAEASFTQEQTALRGVHLTARRAGELAARAGAGRLVLTHLPPWNDPEQAWAQAREAWSGAMDLARPGAVFAL